jgi:hypothetical protein
MQHTATADWTGDWDEVAQWALATLTPLGFRTTERLPTSIEFFGPGLRSSKQPALLGAKQLRLSSERDTLALTADLGGVRWLARFVQIFPGALCFGILAVLVGVFAVVQPQAVTIAAWAGGIAAAANVIVWNLLGPWMARRLERQTRAALDAFLANAVQATNTGVPLTSE